MNGMGSKPLGRELIGIQYLRGLAAMMVVAFHLGFQLTRMGYAGPWPAGLAAGVDIFFVISGFIMWATTRSGATGPVEFLKRRIQRIVPLYWLFTGVMVAVILAAPGLVQSARFDPAHVLASFLFLPALNGATGQLEPVVQPGWTLNCEMFFYGVFALSLTLPRAARFWVPVTGFTALAGLGAVLAPPATSLGAFYTSSVLVEFAFGMALARIVTETAILTSIPPAGAAALAAASLAAVFLWPAVLPPDLPSRVALGMTAMLLVVGLLALELRGALPRIAALRLLGDASYSIYLSQVFTLSMAGQLWRRLHLDALPGGWIGFVLFGLAVGGLGGVAVYRLVERPLGGLIRTRHASRPAPRLVPQSMM